MRLPPLSAPRPDRGARRRWWPVAAGTVLLALIVTPAIAVFAPNVPLVPAGSGLPGRHADGSVQLINQRTITPAGRQIDLGDLPESAILSPDGKHLIVANSGAGIQSLQVVDTSKGGVVQTIPYTVPDSVFVGLAFSPDGKRVYASGGGSNVIHTFEVGADGLLVASGDWKLATKPTPLGDGPWPIGLSPSPDGKVLYVADNLANDVALLDTTSGSLTATIPVGTFPYTALATRDGRHVYVSNWGDATVSEIDPATRAVVATIKVGEHPTALVQNGDHKLYVADANSDAISMIDIDEQAETQRISLAPYDKAPLSTSPVGLAVSPDGKRLYVADGGADEVAVVELKPGGQFDEVLGRVPTAWYPTSVTVSRDGRKLWVTNSKGIGAGPNAGGADPNPTRRNPPVVDGLTGYNDGYCNCSFDKYTGSMIVGTLSAIDVPGTERLKLYTQQVFRDNRYPSANAQPADDRDAPAEGAAESATNPIPAPGGTSPIKHVIYIIKENRTFDQVFGDETAANADPALALFPRSTTPNLHALVERFGILDNFYADAEVSADGHNWAMSANASDYNEKMWPQDYSPAVGRNRGYDFEGATTINLSPGGYLWDAAAQAAITYRDYGEFLTNGGSPTLIAESSAGSCAGPIAHTYTGTTVPSGQVLCFPPTSVNATTTPNLVGHIDPHFRSYDLRYREADRVLEWAREFQQFEASGTLPQLEIMRIPNDHTSGTQPGRLTPQAYVAENDRAIGEIVDLVSHSPDWSSTALFITEDDAQNGPDHVDAHRTESLVISPYTSRDQAFVDHTLYNTSAMVRTMELILGLRPLSQYDANAAPIRKLFRAGSLSQAQLAPYSVLDESVPTTQLNAATAFGAAASSAMDFEAEDRAPMMALNQILWHAVKGADTPYPGAVAEAPVGAASSTDDATEPDD